MTRYALDSLRGRTEFARFCVIGALGFTIDAGVLALLVYGAGLGPFPARILSILAAVSITWGLHRAWTFRSTDPAKLAEWSRFVAVNGAGGGLNLLVYSLVLLAVPATPPLLALAFGSGAALGANYLGSRLWAFRSGSATLP